MPHIRLWWLLHSQWCGIFEADSCSHRHPMFRYASHGVTEIRPLRGHWAQRFFSRRRGLSPVGFLGGDSHCRDVLLRLSRVCSRKGGAIHHDKPKAQKTDRGFYSVFVKTTTWNLNPKVEYIRKEACFTASLNLIKTKQILYESRLREFTIYP